MDTNDEIIEQPAEQPVEVTAAPEPAPTMAEAIASSLKSDEQEGQFDEEISTQDSTRDAQGRFLKKEEKADVKPGEVKPEAKPDSGDEVPEGLTPKAQERFRELATQSKALTEEVATYKETLSNLTNALQTHGVTDEVFRDLLTYSKVVTSGDAGQWRDMLANQVANFERATGQKFGGVDTLSLHPDLRQAVDAGQITEAYAMQLVQSRDVQGRVQQHTQQTQQRYQEQQRQDQELNQGAEQVAAICREFQAKDLDWPAKKPLLEKYANDISSTLPPSQWGNAIRAFYSNIHAPQPVQQHSNVRPLRAQGGAVGTREPQSMHDAIRASLGH